MVELLVVLVIIAILAAVAVPIYLANVDKSKASEGVAAMSLIRQAQRDYKTTGGNYFNVADVAASTTVDGNLKLALPTSATVAGVPTPNPSGVKVDVGTTQYFSSHAYTVSVGPATWTATINGVTLLVPASAVGFPAAPVDFVIAISGANSSACVTSTGAGISCATKAAEVSTYQLMMDNSGRTFVCYGTCGTATNWSTY